MISHEELTNRDDNYSNYASSCTTRARGTRKRREPVFYFLLTE